jgi:hypothetical protein
MSVKSTKGVLQEHMVFQKTRTQSLADVRTLNMWGFELENISIVRQMINAETLAFPVNKISTLAPFESCRHLQQLLLRSNQISNFNELDYLQNLPSLTTLSLIDNPIAQMSNYRDIVLRKLPRLRTLDDVDVSVQSPARPEAVQPQSVRHSPARSAPPDLSGESPVREEPRQRPIRQREPEPRRRAGNDSNMLTAVLSLIPELSPESLHIVLEAIEKRCQDQQYDREKLR